MICRWSQEVTTPASDPIREWTRAVTVTRSGVTSLVGPTQQRLHLPIDTVIQITYTQHFCLGTSTHSSNKKNGEDTPFGKDAK